MFELAYRRNYHPNRCHRHEIINSGAVDIIRTAYYIRGLELMKLIFAVLDVSSTMGLTRCYKTKGFCDEISVRLSVRPSVSLSHTCIVTKRKKDLSRFLYHTKDNLA